MQLRHIKLRRFLYYSLYIILSITSHELREQLGRAGSWGGAAGLEAGERDRRAIRGATTTGCRKEAELGLQGAMGDGRRELEQPTRWRSSGCVELDGATRADEPEQGTWPWLERGTVLVAVLEQGGRRGAMGAGVLREQGHTARGGRRVSPGEDKEECAAEKNNLRGGVARR
jgi:hypothetical protein